MSLTYNLQEYHRKYKELENIKCRNKEGVRHNEEVDTK